MSNIVIDIAAEFTGKKGFKQAETATDKMSKNVKKLAGALGLAFSGQQILAFGKASMKAFAEDEKAAARLTKAVENLGLGFEDARIKTFIADLEKTAGVADDVLRPAFQSLLQTTGSVAKSQELLKLALDVSAGSGIDAVQVSKDLSLAYLGQTKGLTKYNLGLTKAELQTAGFNKIQEKLNDQFSGQNATRLTTYAGKMELLGVAAGNAQEIIGKGLVDALGSLTADNTVSNLATQMESVATYTADTIRGIGVMIGYITTASRQISNIPGLSKIMELVLNTNQAYTAIKLLNELGKANANKARPFTTPMTISGSTDSDVKAEAARKAAEAAAKKRAAELLAMQKKSLKSQQDLLKINKAKAIFDIQKIQIEAALKGKISEEERIRLMLLKAIQEENIEDIEKYTKMLNQVQGKVEGLKTILEETYAMDAGNPFISWEMGLDGVTRALIEINDASIELTSTIAQNSLAMGLLGGASFADALRGANYAAQAAEWARKNGMNPTPILPPAGISPTSPTNPTTVVEVVVQGTVISQQELQQAIVDAVNNSGLTGNQLITGVPERQVAI
jgi:hypothetical protein